MVEIVGKIVGWIVQWVPNLSYHGTGNAKGIL